MTEEQAETEPDWGSSLQLQLTPALLIHALMATASAVHTGWSSCIDEKLVVSDTVSMDDTVGNYVRLAEQEFYEDEDPEVVWHDWTLEVRIANILTTGHWQVPVSASPDEQTGPFERLPRLSGVPFPFHRATGPQRSGGG